MTLAAGRLRHRVRLESPVIARDAVTGAAETGWTLEANRWAAIEPLSVKDFVSADARQSKVGARIVLRPVSGLDASWRVVHGTRIYQIVGVLPDMESGREYVTLAVSEGTNEAGA